MDARKHKWPWQCWKTSPTWDPVILPRPFQSSNIRYMKCYQSLYIVILSEDSNIEIWQSKLGIVVFSNNFNTTIKRIDFIDMYRAEIKLIDNINEWTIVLANKDGDIISTNCFMNQVMLIQSKVDMKAIKHCFYKLIQNTETIILIGTQLLILSCKDFSTLNCLSILGTNGIDCGIILDKDAAISSSEKLYFCEDILSWNNNILNKNCHKSPILELMDIDSIYMASISWEKVVIWKRPQFNLTRIFELNSETMFNNTIVGERHLTCLVHSSRYLIIGLNLGMTILDCTIGSPITEFQCISDTPIIKTVYLDWLSMLLTVSKDGRIRFWAFQIQDTFIDPIKIPSSPFSTKSFSFMSYSRQSSLKEPNQLLFLGKSFEKDKEKCQIVCYLELENSIQSRDHFVNLEDIGMLTSDGTSTLILWRNRDYALTNLIHLLQI